MTIPFHVAITMDGNGRWATRRGLHRNFGHREGVKTVRRIVEAAPDLGITTLTLFAFSSDNWRRPADEVGGLMELLGAYMRSDAERLVESGAKLSLIGRRDRLPKHLVRAIERLERRSEGGDLHLRVALDYSGRAAILEAAAAWKGGAPEDFGAMVAGSADAGAVDLMIRTGGEKRLSDFLLWEAAYAELWFTDTLWPDFAPDEFAAAVADFTRRQRRFGAAPQSAVA